MRSLPSMSPSRSSSSRPAQTLAAPSAPYVYTRRVTSKLDYETELGVVIGQSAHAVPPENALDYVAGYLVLNDLTARDRQVVWQPDGSANYALGPAKNFDGSTRTGAFLQTADLIGDPQDLELSTLVNGELRQHNSTAAMIFPVAELIAFLSRLLTLQPGAVISTGTPGGTGWGTDTELGGTGRTPPGCAPAATSSRGMLFLGVSRTSGPANFR